MTSKEREGVLGEGGYLFERDNVWEGRKEECISEPILAQDGTQSTLIQCTSF